MNILQRIARTFRRRTDLYNTPPVIDYLRDSGGSGDWRKRKLAEAAQKYGRPFKCAGDDMPHEIENSAYSTSVRLLSRKR